MPQPINIYKHLQIKFSSVVQVNDANCFYAFHFISNYSFSVENINFLLVKQIFSRPFCLKKLWARTLSPDEN